MSETSSGGNETIASPASSPAPQASQSQVAPATLPAPPAAMQQAAGPVGKIRGTGVCILLSLVTFGIYTLVWYFKVHEEMKRHNGQGLGGGLALVLAIFVGIAMPYITSSEVGSLYEDRGQRKPVSGLTGLWNFPGVFLLVGPLVWFIKTNGALNGYWRSLGAR